MSAERPPESTIIVRSLALQLSSGRRIDPHAHPWAQLIYATEGVMTVSTSEGAWVVPTERALWVPPDIRHAIEATGRVAMCTLYFRPDQTAQLHSGCRVVGVSPLLRELILEIRRIGMLVDIAPAHCRLGVCAVGRIGGPGEVSPVALAGGRLRLLSSLPRSAAGD